MIQKEMMRFLKDYFTNNYIVLVWTNGLDKYTIFFKIKKINILRFIKVLFKSNLTVHSRFIGLVLVLKSSNVF